MGVVIHAKARRVGNSWAIIIPKEKAEELNISKDREYHIEIKPIDKLMELAGTLKTRKSTKRIMKEIDEGWD